MSEEKKFASFSPLSIQRCAEACGIDALPSEIVDAMAEDVSYRLREIVNTSAQFMRRSRRGHLKVQDVTKALKISNVPWTLGEQHGDFPKYESIAEKDIYILNDDLVDLHHAALSEMGEREPSPTTMSSDWVMVNGKSLSQEEQNIKLGEVPESLLDYFANIVSCVLGDDKDLRKESLSDLRKNPKIAPIVPYFANFALNVKAVSHDIEQLTYLLQTVSALMCNPYLHFLGYLQPFVSSVLYCVLEPLTASINPINDHWKLRDYGSRLVAYIVKQQGSNNRGIIDYVYESIRNIILDPTRPLCSHYGAIQTVNALGVTVVWELIGPNLRSYYQASLKIVEEDSDSNNLQLKEDAFKVLGLIRHSAEMLHNNAIKRDDRNFTQLYKLLDDMSVSLGDSLQSRLPVSLPKDSDDVTQRNQDAPVAAHLFRPLLGKLQPFPRRRLSARRLEIFGPSLVRSKLVLISIGSQNCRPNDPPAPKYVHSDYFALSIKTANIGKCKSLARRHRRTVQHGFLSTVL